MSNPLPRILLGLTLLLSGCQTPLFRDGWFAKKDEPKPKPSGITNPPVASQPTRPIAQNPSAPAGNSATSTASSVRVQEESSKGDFALEQKRFEDARLHFETVLSMDPNNLHAHHMLGRVFDQKGRFNEAEAHYLNAKGLAPNDPNLLCDLGYSYFTQQRHDLAKQYLTQALALQPGHQMALMNLAAVHVDRGDNGQALACYNQIAPGPEAERRLIDELNRKLARQSARTRELQQLAENEMPTSVEDLQQRMTMTREREQAAREERRRLQEEIQRLTARLASADSTLNPQTRPRELNEPSRIPTTRSRSNPTDTQISDQMRQVEYQYQQRMNELRQLQNRQNQGGVDGNGIPLDDRHSNFNGQPFNGRQPNERMPNSQANPNGWPAGSGIPDWNPPPTGNPSSGSFGNDGQWPANGHWNGNGASGFNPQRGFGDGSFDPVPNGSSGAANNPLPPGWNANTPLMPGALPNNLQSFAPNANNLEDSFRPSPNPGGGLNNLPAPQSSSFWNPQAPLLNEPAPFEQTRYQSPAPQYGADAASRQAMQLGMSAGSVFQIPSEPSGMAMPRQPGLNSNGASSFNVPSVENWPTQLSPLTGLPEPPTTAAPPVDPGRWRPMSTMNPGAAVPSLPGPTGQFSNGDPRGFSGQGGMNNYNNSQPLPNVRNTLAPNLPSDFGNGANMPNRPIR